MRSAFFRSLEIWWPTIWWILARLFLQKSGIFSCSTELSFNFPPRCCRTYARASAAAKVIIIWQQKSTEKKLVILLTMKKAKSGFTREQLRISPEQSGTLISHLRANELILVPRQFFCHSKEEPVDEFMAQDFYDLFVSPPPAITQQNNPKIHNDHFAFKLPSKSKYGSWPRWKRTASLLDPCILPNSWQHQLCQDFQSRKMRIGKVYCTWKPQLVAMKWLIARL